MYEYDDELMHFGVKGMRWGVRRTPEQLGRKVNKLSERNKALSSDVNAYNKRALEYDRRSNKVSSKNAKWEGKLAKAKASKIKYEMKRDKAFNKSISNPRNVEKHTAKAAEYTIKANKQEKIIQKAESKLKYNKWSVKSETFKQYAKEAQQRIESNERLIKSYNSTINALNDGTIEQGRVFMRYMIE